MEALIGLIYVLLTLMIGVVADPLPGRPPNSSSMTWASAWPPVRATVPGVHALLSHDFNL
jgi:hypothetical protein